MTAAGAAGADGSDGGGAPRTRLGVVASVLGRVTAWAGGLAFLSILVINLAQMIVRQFGHGWLWVTDVSQLLLIWTVMLGSVAAYCHAEHIATGWLDTKLTGRPLQALLLVLRVVEIGFFAIICAAGISVAQARDSIPYVQLGVPTSWAYASIPVAGALLIVAAVTLPLRPAGTPPPLPEPDLERTVA
ncbi:TRAP transporter small permease [Jiangella gansuensis]|uniref:TRAP transporter small permease n=1 Tax=Jiangella gansuensis TaxID=281473 RepID=UPI00047E4274|nr:TRAP transporter small permease subunit [Jiangella gansuensis]